MDLFKISALSLLFLLSYAPDSYALQCYTCSPQAGKEDCAQVRRDQVRPCASYQDLCRTDVLHVALPATGTAEAHTVTVSRGCTYTANQPTGYALTPNEVRCKRTYNNTHTAKLCLCGSDNCNNVGVTELVHGLEIGGPTRDMSHAPATTQSAWALVSVLALFAMAG